MAYVCQTCVDANVRRSVKCFSLGSLCQHIKSVHDKDVQADCGTHEGYVYCNECLRSNGHGRRLPTFSDMKDHMFIHNIDVREYEDLESPTIPDDWTYYASM
jgi:hypothetical protein